MMVTAAHKGELKRGFESLFCHHAATLAMIYFKYSGGVLWWLPVPPIILTGVGYFYICTTCNQTSCSRIMIGMALQQEEPCHLKANEVNDFQTLEILNLWLLPIYSPGIIIIIFLKVITLFLRQTKRFSVVAHNN